ncbi:MAG: YitT family protein [Firmicutes bacterium]|nr:YitT family protein [Bacillota bacterium]
MNKMTQKFQNWLNTYPKLKTILENIGIFLVSCISSLLAAYIFRSFIVPAGNPLPTPLITGGVSGVSQIFNRLFDLLNLFNQIENRTMQAILYFIFNIPIFILAFTKIGKRFAIFSFINVITTSIFIEIIPHDWTQLITISDDLLSRAIIAGCIQGIASSLAYLMDISNGGMDVITVYFANVKSTSVGKYAFTFNVTIYFFFTILYLLNTESSTGALNAVIFSVIYSFTTSRVVDAINIRNKKTQLQIVTSRTDLPKILMEKFFHGCTVVQAKGGYTNSVKYIVYMVVSSREVPEVVRHIRQVDPESFIDESPSHQVYGKFFIKPIK